MGGHKKKKHVAGYWYLAGIHFIFCQKLDNLEAILVGEKLLWEVGGTEYYEEWESYPCCICEDEYINAEHSVPILVPCTYPPKLPPCDQYHPISSTCQHQVTKTRITQGVSSNQTIYVNNPLLFGGEDRNGGIQGFIDVEFGGPTQQKNAYLLEKTNGKISAHRDLFGLVLKNVVLSCNSPQIKGWAIRGSRMSTYGDWLPAYKEIGNNMNPAHIIMDCLIDVTWGGVGLALWQIDTNSFNNAAYTLHDEGFGLSFFWQDNQPISNFINMVLTHIGGVLYQSYNTGLLTLKLLRESESDPSFIADEHNIINVESYNVKSTEEAVNTCTVKFTNPTLDKDDSVTVSDLSVVARMGGELVTMEKEFYGCRDGTLATKIAYRELAHATLPLASATILINRTASALEIGDLFYFSWEKYGFSKAIMRVTAMDYGSTESEVIRLDCVTDIFSFGDIYQVAPDDGDWDDPSKPPSDLTTVRIEETTYQQLYAEHSTEIPSTADTACYIQGIAEKETENMVDYQLHSKKETDLHYELDSTSPFNLVYLLTEGVDKEISTLLKLDRELDTKAISSNMIYEGSFAYLGDELVMIYAFTSDLKEIHVARGIIDTVPVSHAVDTKFTIISDVYHSFSNTNRLPGEEVKVKFLPATLSNRLPLDGATEHSFTCEGRAGKPYVPGRFMTNGAFWLDVVITNNLGQTVISWCHRDRTQQLGDIVTQPQKNIGPETSVVYNIRIYNYAGSLVVEKNDTDKNVCILQFNTAPASPFNYAPVQNNATYVKETNHYANHEGFKATDSSLITASGSVTNRIWMALNSTTTEAKLSMDLGSAKYATRVKLINTYDSSDSDYEKASVKDFMVYGTNDITAFNNTDYSNTSNLTLLGIFSATKATNYQQIQYFTLTSKELSFRYIVFRFSGTQEGSAVGKNLNLEYINVQFDNTDVEVLTVPNTLDWYRVELEAKRGTIISHNKQETSNAVAGYGKHYGRYYGTKP